MKVYIVGRETFQTDVVYIWYCHNSRLEQGWVTLDNLALSGANASADITALTALDAVLTGWLQAIPWQLDCTGEWNYIDPTPRPPTARPQL